MNTALTKSRRLAGNDFSPADCAIIPFAARLSGLDMTGFRERYPAVDGWWGRSTNRELGCLHPPGDPFENSIP